MQQQVDQFKEVPSAEKSGKAKPWCFAPNIGGGFLFGLCLILISGCSTPSIKNDAYHHMVMVNGRGNPVNPDKSHNPFLRFFKDYEKFDQDGNNTHQTHFQNVMQAMKEYKPNPDNCPSGEKRKVLIFIHGGLNTQTGTIERANDLYKKIEKSCSFPIFVNWQSSLLSSYRDHLFNIRQGKWRDGWHWISLAPFYLIEDLMRSIARIPTSWVFMFHNDFETTAESQYELSADISYNSHKEEYLKNEFGEGTPAIPISEGADNRTDTEMSTSFLKYAVTLPTKLIGAPILDAMGKSSWDVMKHRAHMLFHKEGEFTQDLNPTNLKPIHRSDKWCLPEEQQKDQEKIGFEKGKGGLSDFFCQFREKVNAEPGRWEITLVGHSMGSIIINEILRRFSDVDFTNIVYMGAAATIRDYEDSVFPYLQNHKNTNVFHLVLHHEAEARERWDEIPRVVDLPPRGSLLVWIDNFLSKPETHLDRTVGRWIDMVVTLRNTPIELRNRIHVKSFDVGEEAINACPPSRPCYQPQEHSDLAKGPFWDPAYWEPLRPSQSN